MMTCHGRILSCLVHASIDHFYWWPSSKCFSVQLLCCKIFQSSEIQHYVWVLLFIPLRCDRNKQRWTGTFKIWLIWWHLKRKKCNLQLDPFPTNYQCSLSEFFFCLPLFKSFLTLIAQFLRALEHNSLIKIYRLDYLDVILARFCGSSGRTLTQ